MLDFFVGMFFGWLIGLVASSILDRPDPTTKGDATKRGTWWK